MKKMRKLLLAACVIMGIGMIVLIGYVLKQQHTQSEVRYLAGSLNETIGEREAAQTQPLARWNKIRELDQTVAIDVICQPSYGRISETDQVQEIVGYMQSSTYVKAAEFPNDEPDVKLYFRKKDGFIMAGRLHVEEGVLESPEGPLIQLEPRAANAVIQYANCK